MPKHKRTTQASGVFARKKKAWYAIGGLLFLATSFVVSFASIQSQKNAKPVKADIQGPSQSPSIAPTHMPTSTPFPSVPKLADPSPVIIACSQDADCIREFVCDNQTGVCCSRGSCLGGICTNIHTTTGGCYE